MQAQIDPEFRAALKASRAFAREWPRRTWLEVAPTLVLAVLMQALLLSPLPLLAKLPLSALFGLILVRVFVLFHDMLHGAIFRRSRLGRGLLKLFSLYLVYPPAIWKARHNDHHRHNSRTNSRGEVFGQVPMATLRGWQRMGARQRIAYRCARHPLTLLCGYFAYFLLPVIDAVRRGPLRRGSGLIWVAFPFVAVALIAWRLGPATALVAFVLPALFAGAVGAYLFYAQHCFEGVKLREREHWSYYHAALHTSSMFEMPAWMHWFTGNIGYHHVHHINPQIPFYRLEEAMRAVPALQNPPRTSWRWRDMRYNLTHHIWDDERQQLLTYSEAKARLKGDAGYR